MDRPPNVPLHPSEHVSPLNAGKVDVDRLSSQPSDDTRRDPRWSAVGRGCASIRNENEILTRCEQQPEHYRDLALSMIEHRRIVAALEGATHPDAPEIVGRTGNADQTKAGAVSANRDQATPPRSAGTPRRVGLQWAAAALLGGLLAAGVARLSVLPTLFSWLPQTTTEPVPPDERDPRFEPGGRSGPFPRPNDPTTHTPRSGAAAI